MIRLAFLMHKTPVRTELVEVPAARAAPAKRPSTGSGRTAGLFSLALLLGACAATPSPRVIGSDGHVCKADGLDDLVGKPGSSDLAAEALKRSGAATLRWIQPGMMVTMEFRQDRLDIHLDDKNVITRITCG